MDNKSLVRNSFEKWANDTGGPFELLAPDAEWTIVGSSPLSKTYPNKKAFIDEVIAPFNARMATPLVPSIRGLYADGDTVIHPISTSAMAMARTEGMRYQTTVAPPSHTAAFDENAGSQ
jgi:uncharacterized protein